MRVFKAMGLLPVFALVLFFAAPMASADEVDRTDPVATTKAFLTAYTGQDLAAMAALVNKTNKPMFTELAAQGKEHAAYGDVFGGWRWDSAKAWAGDLGEPRYKDKNEVAVSFHEMSADEVAVIVLTLEDGSWAVEDINSPSKSQLMSLPTTPPQ